VLSVAPSWFELLIYSEYAHTQEVGAGGEAACRSAAAPDRGQLWPSTFVAHLSHVGDDAAPVYTEREFRLYATDCRHGCILNVSMLTPLPDGSPRPYGVWVQEYNSLGAMPAAKKKTSGAAQDADDPSLLDSTDVEEAAAALGIPDDVIGAGVAAGIAVGSAAGIVAGAAAAVAAAAAAEVADIIAANVTAATPTPTATPNLSPQCFYVSKPSRPTSSWCGPDVRGLHRHADEPKQRPFLALSYSNVEQQQTVFLSVSEADSRSHSVQRQRKRPVEQRQRKRPVDIWKAFEKNLKAAGPTRPDRRTLDDDWTRSPRGLTTSDLTTTSPTTTTPSLGRSACLRNAPRASTPTTLARTTTASRSCTVSCARRARTLRATALAATASAAGRAPPAAPAAWALTNATLQAQTTARWWSSSRS